LEAQKFITEKNCANRRLMGECSAWGLKHKPTSENSNLSTVKQRFFADIFPDDQKERREHFQDGSATKSLRFFTGWIAFFLVILFTKNLDKLWQNHKTPERKLKRSRQRP
jgi:hypothetical protein